MNQDRQEHDGRFKLTVAATAFVHVLLLGGLVFVSLSQPGNREENIVWVNPGSFAGNQDTGVASAEIRSRRHLRARNRQRPLVRRWKNRRSQLDWYQRQPFQSHSCQHQLRPLFLRQIRNFRFRRRHLW